MIAYTVDRCYDRYIISLSAEADKENETGVEEGSTLETLLEYVKTVILSVVDDHYQAGRLRSCKLCRNDDGENIFITADLEAAEGEEATIAGAIDAVSTAMVILSDRYPEVSVEI